MPSHLDHGPPTQSTPLSENVERISLCFHTRGRSAREILVSSFLDFFLSILPLVFLNFNREIFFLLFLLFFLYYVPAVLACPDFDRGNFLFFLFALLPREGRVRFGRVRFPLRFFSNRIFLTLKQDIIGYCVETQNKNSSPRFSSIIYIKDGFGGIKVQQATGNRSDQARTRL